MRRAEELLEALSEHTSLPDGRREPLLAMAHLLSRLLTEGEEISAHADREDAEGNIDMLICTPKRLARVIMHADPHEEGIAPQRYSIAWTDTRKVQDSAVAAECVVRRDPQVMQAWDHVELRKIRLPLPKALRRRPDEEWWDWDTRELPSTENSLGHLKRWRTALDNLVLAVGSPTGPGAQK